MNYNPKIFTEGSQIIANNYGLMSDVIKIMTLCDGHQPLGACCGKNYEKIANKFIANKKNYKSTMEKIEQKLIKTIKPGILYISPLRKMVNLDLLTDQEIIKYTDKGYISKDRFDWSMYGAGKVKQTKPEAKQPEPETEQPEVEQAKPEAKQPEPETEQPEVEQAEPETEQPEVTKPTVSKAKSTKKVGKNKK